MAKTKIRVGDHVQLKNGRYIYLGRAHEDLSDRIGTKSGVVTKVNVDIVQVEWEGVKLKEHESDSWSIDLSSLLLEEGPTDAELNEVYALLGAKPKAEAGKHCPTCTCGGE